MLYITQIVYVHAGKEPAFEEFESGALPLMARHGGELLLRLRPSRESVVAHSIDAPYEVHIVRFPNDEAFARFAADEERQHVLHLKEGSVRASLLIRGNAV
jgi:uncharacterized protein (DUF1330 family)